MLISYLEFPLTNVSGQKDNLGKALKPLSTHPLVWNHDVRVVCSGDKMVEMHLVRYKHTTACNRTHNGLAGH